MIEAERIEFDQQGTVRGVKVADRVYRLSLQQSKQLQHLLMSFKGDVPAKRDEKGLIACGAEQRCSGCVFAHALLRGVLCVLGVVCFGLRAVSCAILATGASIRPDRRGVETATQAMRLRIKSYDAIVIGSGQAGNPLCYALAERGWTVARIEWVSTRCRAWLAPSNKTKPLG